MDVDNESVQTLLNMGFPSETEIRRALKLSKNDLSEAVAILTNEHTSSNYDTLDDVEMKETDRLSTRPTVYGPTLPPTYDEVVVESDSTLMFDSCPAKDGEGESPQASPEEDENSLEFPVANLYELENRVFTESWSIPYKREESLGKCLLSAARLAQEGLADNDQHCRRFMDRCMPESFQKLLTAGAVHRWGPEIQEGIYSMLQLLVDLVATRIKYAPVPVGLLNALALAFNPTTEFHTKNKSRRPDRLHWEEVFGQGQTFASSPPANSYKDPYGWLTNVINRFAEKEGFDSIKERLEEENVDAPTMAALLQPFGQCAELMNTKVVQPILAPGMEIAVKYVQKLSGDDLKEKKVGCVSDMLASMKLLCLHLWPNEVKNVDELRLDVALRMLKSPHFNARMNSLKEVTKLIEDSCSTKITKTAIHQDKIIEWLVDNEVLSIALEGNIDQVQYCDKIKNLVDFLGSKLSIDELTKIWKMQTGQTNMVIDNIHSIIAAAGVKFNETQLEHLFLLIQESWKDENDRMKEKFLNLLGKIGKDARSPKTTSRVLELLWELAHRPNLSTALIEQALDHHLGILNDAYTVKEAVKKSYVIKCVDDIKKGTWVLPALRQLLQISKNIAKHSYSKAEKGILQELNKSYDIIKQVTNSLMKFHQVAASQAKHGLTPDTTVDGRYTHKDFVMVHLNFLQFILQDGALYLPWHRARDIWETLIANPDACFWDKETVFEWFTKGMSDLEQETQSQMFQKELLKLEPKSISTKGFACFKSFFENVNIYEHKLKKPGMVVEKMDLIGLDFLWQICLNTPDPTIAESGITLLMNVSYSNLAPRLKKDLVGLHKKFIDECKSRLEAAVIPLGSSVWARALSCATTVASAVIFPDAAALPNPSRSSNLLCIERLLLIAERYVLIVEESYTSSRTILPHGASFRGDPLSLFCTCESPKMDFNIKVHSNETIESVRLRIANKLKYKADQIQMVVNDKMLQPSKDQKLVSQLQLEDNTVVSVRAFTSSVSSSAASSSSSQIKEIQESLRLDEDASSNQSAKQQYELEQEKMLPGVVMGKGGDVFEMLYRLSDLDEPKITNRVKSLLNLIPTDPAVSDALDHVGQRLLRQPSPEEPSLSPRSSPRKFTPSPTPPSTSSKPTNTKEVLKSLFDPTATDMSTFRVLYNLEVLSSKLMPSIRDAGSLQSAKMFCEDFLNATGLNMVVNVLQKYAIPTEVDYETRQGCYSTALQLLGYLLCGNEAPPSEIGRRGSSSSGGFAGPSSLGSSGPSSFEGSAPAAITRAVQTMSVGDFTDMVSCFMRVAWAAAAGRLHLVSTTQTFKESSSIYNTANSRSRQSSTGSTASSGSETEGNSLHAGVCVKQSTVSPKDAHIAKEALELLVTCLQMRSQLLASFYNQPAVADFIIDILVGSTQSDIRDTALDQFYVLSQTETQTPSNSPTPQAFMLNTLLKARLPFWVTVSSTRGASYRLLKQCTQYFSLRCRLLGYLSKYDQKQLSVDVNSMLEDELAWLTNFQPSDNPEIRETDNTLLAGHLKLIKTLLTCEGIDKKTIGKQLIQDVLHEFLFPAARQIMGEPSSPEEPFNNHSPVTTKCSDSLSRIAAYDVLVELSDGCVNNLSELCKELITMHHQANTDLANEWEYMPPVEGRASVGFVGLKNGGATCYMNSVIQQLFMTPGVVEQLLGIDEENVDEESVFHQMQYVFGHLLESKLQYYIPERFWKVFKLWGQGINIREQQDALDFYQALIDQVDEQVKKLGREEVFRRKFQGVFSDQKICKDCPHRYEREEVFFALSVTVKNETLQDSLAQYVKGELLDGDNAYFCEKCGEKRNTIKRMCIKTLPPTLCIQLKRFDYDWEANRALKFDDYFKFPWILDMEPYTAEGMARREEEEELSGSCKPSSSPISSSQMNRNNSESGMDTSSVQSTPTKCGSSLEVVNTTAVAMNNNQINYELVGVVVHSGQANAGHYYSFIKDRRGTHLSNPNKGKWYKFNDTVIEEFEMNDASLEAECFGGAYKAKVYDHSSSYPEDRLRYWNGYLLFYERVEEIRTPMSAKKSRITVSKRSEKSTAGLLKRSSDSFVELTDLVHKGEKQGIFTNKMPAPIQQVVREENLGFMKNRDVYDIDYFRFVKKLVTKASSQVSNEHYTDICLQALQLGVHFLHNTYFRTKKKLRIDMTEWVSVMETILQRCKEACTWMVEFLSMEGQSYLKPFLLECPTREVRTSFSKVVERTMAGFFHHGGSALHKCFDKLVSDLLDMLNKDVSENIKTCSQYFWLLHMYVQMGTMACSHMYGKDAFMMLITFLLGPTVTRPNAGGGDHSSQELALRRWSSVQARDFGALHATLATLILNSDVSPHRTESPGSYAIRNPTTVVPTRYLKMKPEMQAYLFGVESAHYIREVVLALREVTGSTSTLMDMLLYCSFCNSTFSINLLKNIMLQYTSAPANELKGLFDLLTQLLVLEDGLQLKRLQCVIDGYVDEDSTQYEGMLAVIKSNHVNESRRSYQCIKFLVALAHKCSHAKDYLLQNPTKWQWAVNWLKKKMSEFSWQPVSTSLASNEDSNSRSFQRTISAQDTLAEATALLTEFEAQDTQEMEIGSTSTGSAVDSGYGTNGGSTDKIAPEGDTETEPGDSQETQKFFVGGEEEEDDQL